jgi:hypothetical protein
MLKLTLAPEQRLLLAETVRDIANIAAGALVFGQAPSSESFSPWLAIAGAVLWCGFVGYAVYLVTGRAA